MFGYTYFIFKFKETFATFVHLQREFPASTVTNALLYNLNFLMSNIVFVVFLSLYWYFTVFSQKIKHCNMYIT